MGFPESEEELRSLLMKVKEQSEKDMCTQVFIAALFTALFL